MKSNRLHKTKAGQQLGSDCNVDNIEDKSNEKTSVTENKVEKMNAAELKNINKERENITHVKNGSAAIYMKATGILMMLLGLIVSILNIIFIYIGIHSDWYHVNIGVLKVINICEGIIAGTLYMILASLFSSTCPRRSPQL